MARFFAVCVVVVSTWLAAPSALVADEVIPYPRLPGDEPNPQYSVTVNGTPIDTIATTMDVGYAHFAFEGTANIEVTASEPIREFDLSPHRLGIEATANGNVLSFSIDEPRKLHLRINGLKRFFLFADAPETSVPTPDEEGVYTLADFGVVSSLDEVQTQKIQAAIDAVAEKKGTLIVPAGHYNAGRLDLRSNLKLYLAPGAIIRGTARLEDYPRGPVGLVQLQVVGGENIHIFGRGVIDGNGKALRDQFLPDRQTGRAKMMVAHDTRDMLIEDVILRDSAVWCMHARQSRNITYRNLKIISIARSETGPDTSHNTDAFDPDNSSNILIENNFISVDDDAIAVKLTGGERADMRNIVFKDNVIWTMCAALKIGTEVMGGFTMRDVVFENNDVVHAESAIVVQCYRGGYVDGARWVGNYIEQVAAVPNNSPHRKSALIYLNARSEDSFGGIRNVLIKDNAFEGFSAADAPSMLRAKGPTQYISDVVIENLVIAGARRTSADEARMIVAADVHNLEFR